MAEKHQAPQPAPETAAQERAPPRISAAKKSLFSEAAVCSNIGKGLRALYMELLREPLPSQITDPLKKINDGRR